MVDRAITQIAVSSPGDGVGPDVVYALAEDGTLWELVNQQEYGWRQLPPLPAVGAVPEGRTPVK